MRFNFDEDDEPEDEYGEGQRQAMVSYELERLAHNQGVLEQESRRLSYNQGVFDRNFKIMAAHVEKIKTETLVACLAGAALLVAILGWRRK